VNPQTELVEVKLADSVKVVDEVPPLYKVSPLFVAVFDDVNSVPSVCVIDDDHGEVEAHTKFAVPEKTCVGLLLPPV
jgi:hypothetical protein